MSKLSFDVTGMHCASCAAAVERAVKKLPGASDVYVNFAANRLTLEAAPELTPEQVADAVRKAGFGAEPVPALPVQTAAPEEEAEARRETFRFTAAIVFAALLSYVAMYEMLHLPFFPLKPEWNALIQILLLLPVVVAGFRFYTSGFRALFRGSPNMDSLIASGT